MIRALARLIRWRLALLNGVAALGGCLIYPAGVGSKTLWASFGGVALLAAGGSTFNQVLERDLDCLMSRTSLRPLPRRVLTPVAASVVGATAMLAGLVLLGSVGGFLSPLLGAAALGWYLVVYTPLKRRTPLALGIGAVCGALSPVIGWSCAGGSPTDYRVMLLAGLLYLWQIPHFWLIQRRHADDFLRAGIPLFRVGTEGASSTGICRLWVVAVAAAAMLLPAFGIIGQYAAFWYTAFSLALLLVSCFLTESVLYSYLNLFPLMVTLALCA